jgi:TATA element modulatory factor
VRSSLSTTQHELEASREQLASLKSSSKATEVALEQTRADLERQRAVARDFPGEVERRQWVDDIPGPGSRNQSRPDSPLLPVSRTFSSDLISMPGPGRSRRPFATPSSIPDSPGEGPAFVRRLSSQPPGRNSAMSTTGSGPPPTPYSPFEPPSETSQVHPHSIMERDDTVDEKIPSSPRNVAQDMISVSTVAAGPSVQLVERMSSAIRRLEAEKVAAKEEMTRVCSQRDEARADMVGLMKQLEEAKSSSIRVQKLEEEVETINSRYQTTLELLGEKSELVEELKADVQDVKAMYRELVERTVK